MISEIKNLHKGIVAYSESFELKQIGFNEPCLAYYCRDPYGDCRLFFTKPLYDNLWFYAPFYHQAFKFFEKKYNLYVNKTGNKYYTSFNIVEPEIKVLSFVRYTDSENHFEEAELQCLRKLIEIVKGRISIKIYSKKQDFEKISDEQKDFYIKMVCNDLIQLHIQKVNVAIEELFTSFCVKLWRKLISKFKK